MRKYSLILIAFVAISCNKHQQPQQPLIFGSSYNYQFNKEIIIGADTQQVDSIFKKDFDIDRSHVWVVGSFGAYSHVRKYYVKPDIQRLINRYIIKHHNPNWKYSTVHPTAYNYLFTYQNEQGHLEYSWLNTKSHSDDEDTALAFFNGLKQEIERSPSCNRQCKLFLRDLELLIKREDFPFLPIQQKIFLEKFIETQLTPSQKELLKRVVNLNEVKFVDTSGNP